MHASRKAGRFVRHLAARGAIALLCATSAQAEPPYPARPLTLIVPYAAGGTTDVVARQFAVALQRALGQSVVVENKPGVAGTMGATALTRARPDGYTLAVMPISVFRQPFIQKTPFDPATDFTYLARITGYTFGAVVRADSPWQGWHDFLAAARARPGMVSYGSPGQFTSPHLTMMELAGKENLTVNHVPFKGDADCLNSLMGNHVQLCAAGSSAGTLVDAGKLRWLNLWTAQRSPRWPDAPTLRELGYDIVSNSPYGVAGPKNMEPHVVRILEAALRRAAEDPQHLAALKLHDQDLMYLDSAGYTRYAMQQIAREKTLVRRLGIKAD
ncbi:Bug family tripartite tricarboxylate transporter substrate binding protein [Cupriavidus sp. 30B13]|uniref:Bug family tripartite tricarboxylate transporter substrate binding protein n=1 Tax=Cupriavidus sp. 30B13 TaxID=3384241 RepID=UPI003B8FD9C0